MVELKQAVKALHKAGIEVILDVVYNHTAEGNELGPTLNLPRPSTTALITSIAPPTGASTTTSPAAATPSPAIIRSCRPTSWRRCAISPKSSASTDSASTSPPCSAATARASIPTRRSSRCCAADPVLAYVKLIAEPWDVGLGGYQLGNFPAGLERVERPLPRHHARVLARRPPHAGRIRRTLRGFLGPVPPQRPQTHGQHQLRRRA